MAMSCLWFWFFDTGSYYVAKPNMNSHPSLLPTVCQPMTTQLHSSWTISSWGQNYASRVHRWMPSAWHHMHSIAPTIWKLCGDWVLWWLPVSHTCWFADIHTVSSLSLSLHYSCNFFNHRNKNLLLPLWWSWIIHTEKESTHPGLPAYPCPARVPDKPQTRTSGKLPSWEIMLTPDCEQVKWVMFSIVSSRVHCYIANILGQFEWKMSPVRSCIWMHDPWLMCESVIGAFRGWSLAGGSTVTVGRIWGYSLTLLPTSLLASCCRACLLPCHAPPHPIITDHSLGNGGQVSSGHDIEHNRWWN